MMSVRNKRIPSNRKLTLTVQYASEIKGLPTRKQFRKWAEAALESDAKITLRIVDLEEGHILNKQFRGKDYATNVLTFPYIEEDPVAADIVLCAPIIAEEAKQRDLDIDAYYAHLVVHGVLHMHGYDHEQSDEAIRMEKLESEIVMRLGYADPYALV